MQSATKQVLSQKNCMNIALIGYGRMGHEIEAAALSRGHKIKVIIDFNNTGDLNESVFKGVDAAIEFSSPESAFENISKCLQMKVPVVSGTTGWLDNYEKALEICSKNDTSFIHSSNYSIGVNLIFLLNRELARRMDSYTNYSVSIEEIHHTRKLDSPSGTAITLAEGIIEKHGLYDSWCFENEKKENCVPISSVREGDVPGTHTISWESDIDTLILRHEAKNRRGFALGAVVAAEFICSRQGIFTMSDVMGF
jgi:4-hydroxy-tetrahydrodipicolinate reductase